MDGWKKDCRDRMLQRERLYSVFQRLWGDGNNRCRCSGLWYKAGEFCISSGGPESLPFEDKSIDLTVSFGTLEHIQPIEKLCKVISEINRVSKQYIILVPSISTFFEPHTNSFFWPTRQKGKKHLATSLNYFSYEAWLQFSGFTNAKITRFYYFPGLISNTIIYSTGI